MARQTLTERTLNALKPARAGKRYDRRDSVVPGLLVRVTETGTREGRVLAPFLTQGLEGFNVDDEDDWARAEELVASGRATLTSVDRTPWPA